MNHHTEEPAEGEKGEVMWRLQGGEAPQLWLQTIINDDQTI